MNQANSFSDKILLVNLPWQKDGKLGVRAGSRWPHIKDLLEDKYMPFPFFLAYSAALLKQHGYKICLIDAIAEKMTQECLLGTLDEIKAQYLVAETSIPSFYDDLAILEKVALKGIKVILCGPNHEIYKQDFLAAHPFISYVLCGEYEFILLNLMDALRDNRDLSCVDGLIYRKTDHSVIKNANAKPCNVDLLPWPHRESLPMDNYLDAPGCMPVPSVQMMASRGCPYSCAFCLWPQVIYGGRHYRARDISDVIDEMEFLVEIKGFKSVYFDDDTFNIGKDRMLNFTREIKKRKLNKIPWAIMARPDLMDEEILKSMKDAGLWAVKYGLESASQVLVDSIGKSMDLKKSQEMIYLTKKLGIRTHLTFTFGLPGETKDTINKTIDLALKLSPFSVQFSITTPFPGTRFYQQMEEEGYLMSNRFDEFDGHANSVIGLPSLSAQELKAAKDRAYKIWDEHVKLSCGQSVYHKFLRHYREKGLFHAIHRSIDYAKKRLTV